MKSIFAIPAIVCIASAAAVPRSNDPCASNGGSTAPEPPDNTLSGFNDYYGQLASEVPIPSGYRAVMTNANCALASNKYMTYVKMESYDVQACADVCSSHAGCDAFNIYVQRDPAVVPGPNCPNPDSISTANCALYSEPIAESACTNFGQNIGPIDANGEAFEIAIRGSNIYSKFPTKEVTKTVTTTEYMQALVEERTDGPMITLAPRQEDENGNQEVRIYGKTFTGVTIYHVWNGHTLQVPSVLNRTVDWLDDNTEPYQPNVYVTPTPTSESPSTSTSTSTYIVTKYVDALLPAAYAVRLAFAEQASPTPQAMVTEYSNREVANGVTVWGELLSTAAPDHG